MTPHPVVVPGWITVQAFVEDYVVHQRLPAFPVHNFDGSLAGVVALSVLGRVPPHQRPAVRVRDVAVPLEKVLVARSDQMVLDLMERIPADAEVAALVVDHGRLVGMVSSADIARALEVAALRHGVPPADNRSGRRTSDHWAPASGV